MVRGALNAVPGILWSIVNRRRLGDPKASLSDESHGHLPKGLTQNQPFESSKQANQQFGGCPHDSSRVYSAPLFVAHWDLDIRRLCLLRQAAIFWLFFCFVCWLVLLGMGYPRV